MDLPVPIDPYAGDARVLHAVRDFSPGSDLDALMVCFNLVRVTDRLVHDVEVNVHRPAGLTWAAYRMLFAIRSAGPMTPLQIARITDVSQASVSSGLKTLERNGLIRREPSPSDGRSVTVHLTDAGAEVLAELYARNNEREVAWASALTPEEQETLVGLLRKLRAHEPAPSASPSGRLIASPVG
jgi:DNA-binding MarR family transcriptional regulator